MAEPRLHIVIPARNEAARLGACLDDLLPALAATAIDHRVLVVDDASVATERVRMSALISARVQRWPGLAPMHTLEQHAGKGGAIRAGWAMAGAVDWLGFVDADGAIPGAEVARMAEMAAGQSAGMQQNQPPPVLVARRTIRSRRPVRRLATSLFNLWVRAWLGLPQHDTQAPCKLVPAEAYVKCRDNWRESGWAFDLELLVTLRDGGWAVREVSVASNDVSGSRLRLWRDGPALAWATARIAARRGGRARQRVDS